MKFRDRKINQIKPVVGIKIGNKIHTDRARVISEIQYRFWNRVLTRERDKDHGTWNIRWAEKQKRGKPFYERVERRIGPWVDRMLMNHPCLAGGAK